MHIECTENNTVINIVCTFYGIDPTLRCENANYESAPTSCFSKTSMFKVSSECNGRSSCTFSGEISFEADSGFTNACHGYPSMLFVQWECVLPVTTTITGSTQPARLSQLPENSQLPISREQSRNSRPPSHPPPIDCLPSSSNSIYSPYEPVFLTNSTQSYLGYPISQQLVCQGSRLILLCPLELVIHIYAAYFGLQSETLSPSCWPKSTTSDVKQPPAAKCYVPSSLETIRETCEGRRSCQLRASPTSLGRIDYCPMYSKQLFVQYQCVHASFNTTIAKCRTASIENNNNNTNNHVTIPPVCNSSTSLDNNVIHSNTWCNGSSGVNISCLNNESIRVLCAFYGVHPSSSSTCNTTTSNVQEKSELPVCYVRGSIEKLLIDECDGRASCFIDQIDSTLFDDACVGVAQKALFAQWQCV